MSRRQRKARGSQPTRNTKPGGWRGVLLACRPDHVCPQRLLVGLLCVVGYTLLLSANVFRPAVSWELGDTATRDVIADNTVRVPDETATAKKRRAAMALVPKQYEPTPAADEAENLVNSVFSEITARATEWQATQATHAAQDPKSPLPDPPPLSLSIEPSLRQWVYEASPEHREKLRWLALYNLRKVYSGHEIRSDQPEDFESADRELRRAIASVPLREDRELLLAIVTHPQVLKHNYQYMEYETWRDRISAAEAVDPVYRTVNRSDLVLHAGSQVTEEDLKVIEALGLLQPQWDYAGLFALGCLVCVVLLILGAYVRQELPHIYHDSRRVILLNLVAAGALLLFRFLLWLKGEIHGLDHFAIFCGSTAGMVVSVLIDFRLAMMMTGAMALLMGVLVPSAGLWVAFEAWLAGRVGAMALHQIRDRGELAKAGLIVAVAGMMIAAVVNQPGAADATAYGAQQLLTDLALGFAWSLIAFLVAQGLVPMLERSFGCLTPFRLLELTNTSTPVLQQLKAKARGSFDASLTIGDMAADACEQIPGADPLLARACGYHHDIGKMRHPSWFIENQFGAENVHDKIPPHISAKAIRSHVEDGLLLAEEYNLPRPVWDVIGEHHGTTLISFFYYQALEASPEGQTVDESQFRYRGPRPHSKESGVIMLADGIEAAVRAVSMHGPLPEKRIQEVVDSVIRKRLDESQLDNCELTLHDIDLAAKAFCEFLKGMYHTRIDYPQQALARKRNGGNGGSSS